MLDADSGWYWVDGETGESVWAEETNDAAGPFSEDSAWDQRVHVVQDEWETFIDESGNPYEISRATGDRDGLHEYLTFCISKLSIHRFGAHLFSIQSRIRPTL